MKQVVIHRPGGFNQLQIEESAAPSPRSDQVLISCRACGVNFADVCVRMGVYAPAEKYIGWPITPGFEVAGTIEKLGENVKNLSIGDRVIALTRFGGYTSHLIVKSSQVFPLPDSWSFSQGAAFPSVFLTAYYALNELAHSKKGDCVLIHSAAGGVGGALVQLAKAAGLYTVGVVGGPHKIESVQNLGADVIIDKSNVDLWKSAEKAVPNGYQAIFDANGVETLQKSYDHLAVGGKLVVYGFHTMLEKGQGKINWLKAAWNYIKTPRFNPLTMTGDNKSVLAFNLAYMFDRIELFRDAIEKLQDLAQKGLIHLPEVTEFPLEQVANAHKALQSGQTTGKIVLIP